MSYFQVENKVSKQIFFMFPLIKLALEVTACMLASTQRPLLGSDKRYDGRYFIVYHLIPIGQLYLRI